MSPSKSSGSNPLGMVTNRPAESGNLVSKSARTYSLLQITRSALHTTCVSSQASKRSTERYGSLRKGFDRQGSRKSAIQGRPDSFLASIAIRWAVQWGAEEYQGTAPIPIEGVERRHQARRQPADCKVGHLKPPASPIHPSTGKDAAIGQDPGILLILTISTAIEPKEPTHSGANRIGQEEHTRDRGNDKRPDRGEAPPRATRRMARPRLSSGRYDHGTPAVRRQVANNRSGAL